MGFWRTLLQSCKTLPPSWHVTESSKGHSTIWSSQQLQDDGECSETSEFHEHGLSMSSVSSDACVEYHYCE